MMNNIRLFLNFKNIELGFGKIEITEPIGFDASNFVALKDAGRYGRDVEYGNVDIELEFQDVATDKTENVITLPNGVRIDRLTMGLPFLLEADRLYGFEAEIEFIVNIDGEDFTVGVLDNGDERETDGTTYYRTKVIQNTDKAELKRRESIKVDLFSNDDLDGNNSEPVEYSRILLKAKPIPQMSSWTIPEPYGSGFISTGVLANFAFPLGIQLQEFEIENSFVVFEPTVDYPVTGIGPKMDDVKIMTLQNQASDIKISIKNLWLQFLGDQEFTDVQGRLRIYYGTPPDFTNLQYIELVPANYYLNIQGQDFEATIDYLPAGSQIAVVVDTFIAEGFNYTGQLLSLNYDNLKVSIISTSFDSVINGVRHIDLIKKTAEKVGQYNVFAPRYDIGGEFYNNFVFNGAMIRQFLERDEDGMTFKNIRPLYVTYKDIIEQLQELNADYQVLNGRNIFIGQDKDYYPNRDLGAFVQTIDKDFTSGYNEEYLLQSFNYRYQEYEQDEDEKGTIEAVHTEAEFMLPNKQVEGVKEINVPYTRDDYRIERVRRQNFVSTRTTSTSNDDKFFILDVVELEENSKRTLVNVLDINITNSSGDNTTTVKLLSKDNFAWDLLGFEIGDNVTLYVANNSQIQIPSIYEVIELEPTLVTLQSNSYSSGTTTGQYTTSITLEYPLTNVQFTNRTSEGFNLITGVSNPNNVSNLAYTIRRNMKHWESFIHTASLYKESDGILKNTYWKSNGELVTRLVGENNEIKENESVKINSLAPPLITPRTYRTTIISEWDKVLQLINRMNEVQEDGTIGGFIRVEVDREKIIKGYIKELDYTWATQQLTLTLEEKYESDYVNIYKKIDKKGAVATGFNIYFINEVGYPLEIVYPLHYKATGNFLQLFDNNGIPLINPTHYSKVEVKNPFSLNTQTFTNIIDLCKAIDEL